MADSLKVSPTMIKQPAVSRHQADPQVPFQIKDVSKVNNLNVSKQTSSQNQTLLNSDGPKLLMDLLKNPENSTHFLRSLYLLQEISQMVPLDNKILNNDLENLFSIIFLKSDSVLSELLNQSNKTSLLKGELFDRIRELLKSNPENEASLVQLLKSMNHERSKSNFKQSLVNQADYLKNEFKDLKQVKIIEKFIESLDNDEEVSQSFITMISECEKSIIFNPEMKRNVGVMHYNLSRYCMASNLEDVLESFKSMLAEEFESFSLLVKQYLEKPMDDFNASNVIDRITQVLELEIEHSNVLGLTHEKIESIVISLLSSPSNFIPLLHFVIPMQGELLQAYSEVWVDVDSDTERQSTMHVLCAIEIEQFGHFEVEIWQVNDRVKCDVLCPSEYVEMFKPLVHNISKRILNSTYKLDQVNIKELNSARSLLDVFTHLNSLQNGLNLYA